MGEEAAVNPRVTSPRRRFCTPSPSPKTALGVGCQTNTGSFAGRPLSGEGADQHHDCPDASSADTDERERRDQAKPDLGPVPTGWLEGFGSTLDHAHRGITVPGGGRDSNRRCL
jgi:hypothetical protein